MAKKKRLSKKQLAVIEEMFSGELDEQQVLDKHKVSRNVYNRWLADENFCAEFDRRIDSAKRQGELIIAKYASLAAAKLVQLTESKSQETARKACLDIISLPPAKKPQGPSETEPAGEQEQPQLSDETVSRLLAVLAEEKKENTK